MTQPSRPSPASEGKATQSQGPPDQTVPRTNTVAGGPPAGRVEAGPDFAPPQHAGELGTFGRYRVLKELGRGGMGAVYLGYDDALGRKVALKVMLPGGAANADARERFLREARSAARVRSDHVVTIFDVGQEQDTPFIAMEYLLGSPLDKYLRDKGELPLPHAVRIGRETALGLSAAHELGLVHRDIKPGNLWLEAPKGRVKLIDFGLARLAKDDVHLTGTGAVLGTPAYMSPEQGRGLAVDHRSDLFSLGVMLYRLSTGQMPFKGDTVMAVLTSLAVDTPAPARQLNPHIPDKLEAVIGRLLAKNPDERFQSAREVADALRDVEHAKSASGTMPVVVPIPVPVQPLVVGAQTQNVWAGIADSGSVPVPLATGAKTEPDSPSAPVSAPKRRRRQSGRKQLWLAILAFAGVLAAAAVAVVTIKTPKGTLVIETDDPDIEVLVKRDGAVIRDKTKDREIELKVGEYTIELAEQKEGLKLNTDKFEITRNGKARVRVWLEKPKPPVAKQPPAPDPDRKAAEYVLSVGGSVAVNGKDWTANRADLPKERFTLTAVSLVRNEKATDAGLASFKDCKSLTHLDLGGTKVTDEGLVHFKDCKDLTFLSLASKQVGDAGLVHFKGCKGLTVLYLDTTQVTDAGLENFKDCRSLTVLSLDNTSVGDKGLASFKECKELIALQLTGTNVTNAGLESFKDRRGLTTLALGGTQVDDAGLAYFKDCKQLTYIDVRRTKVTPKMVAGFAEAHPRCKIEHDGGVIEPTAVVDPDRRAAEWVLSAGGVVRVNGGAKDLKTKDELPKEPFTLTRWGAVKGELITDETLANFGGCQHLTELWLGRANVGDAGVAHFKDCKKLTTLDLHYTKVTDAGLAHFKGCKDVTFLYLDHLPVTDDGLANFKGCKGVSFLSLANTKVGDRGLAHFKGCKAVTHLSLPTQVTDEGVANFKDCQNLKSLFASNTRVTDAGLAHFRNHKTLTTVWVSSTSVGDAGLDHLKTCAALGDLSVQKTRVTAAKVAELARALPRCKISHDGGVIEPKK